MKSFPCARLAAILCLLVLLVSSPASAQTTGAFNAQPGLDLAGNWAPVMHEDQPERGAGPPLADYLGLPITDGARLFAESWDASRLTLPEHQCQVHIASYIYRGPLNLRIWEEKDPQSQRVIAIKQYISTYEQTRTIWMDGRPHPPESAAHTWMGFSTGKWEGNVLTVYTTHIKQGWVRRNGLPASDQASLTEHFIRYGNLMTHVSILNDPVYLTEPLIKSQDFLLNVQAGQNWLYPCEYVDEVANRPRGTVPHYLPGENPFLHEFADRYKIPVEAALGGAETSYPEYQAKLKNKSTAASSVAKAVAPAAPRAPQNPNPASSEIQVLPVQGNVYMLAGAGGNITVQIGQMGVIVVDTGLAAMSEKVIAAIRKLSDRPLQYIINTHAHADHTGGNDSLRKAGVTITGANVAGNLTDAAEGAQIIAHVNVLNRMSAPTGQQASAPFGSWPTETYVSGQKELYFNEEPVEIIYQPAAHTDGDSFVFFRHSDVVSTGDIFVTTSYPFLDLERGGGIQGEINALNRLLDLTIPKHDEEGGTYVIPGHGRICDEFDVLEYRDMVTIIRDRVQASIKKGLTLEQVKAAQLTKDYDARYGSPDRFVEAVYKSLNATK
jgi:glyoxylase-like metal-dependent hydrolase (beta-lactamase superfamily II)